MMWSLTRAANVGLEVFVTSRAAPCATFSVTPLQESGIARVAASCSPGLGRGVPGPRAPRCPLSPTGPRPSFCSALGSLCSVTTSRPPQGPRRFVRVPPLPQGCGTWSPRSGPLPRRSLARLLGRLCPSLSPSLPLPPPPPPSGSRSSLRPRLARVPELPPPAARRELPTRSTRPAWKTFAPPHT